MFLHHFVTNLRQLFSVCIAIWYNKWRRHIKVRSHWDYDRGLIWHNRNCFIHHGLSSPSWQTQVSNSHWPIQWRTMHRYWIWAIVSLYRSIHADRAMSESSQYELSLTMWAPRWVRSLLRSWGKSAVHPLWEGHRTCISHLDSKSSSF